MSETYEFIDENQAWRAGMLVGLLHQAGIPAAPEVDAYDGSYRNIITITVKTEMETVLIQVSVLP